MLGHSISKDPIAPSLDITAPKGPVQVEIDRQRGVLYVHVEGFTCLRICRMSEVNVIEVSHD